MPARYSKSTNSFYQTDIDYASLPADLIEVSIDDYQAAMSRPAGHTFDFVDGALVITAPPAPSLESLKAAALANLNAQSQKIADSLTAGYPEFEKMTWEDQRREALAWNADNSTPTPYIDILATTRGIDRVDYLKRTVAKTTAFAAAAQKLVGQRQKYEDQIKAAQTAEALALVNPVFDLS